VLLSLPFDLLASSSHWALLVPFVPDQMMP